MNSALMPMRIGVAAMIFCANPAWSVDSVTAEALRLYGGVYSANCADPAAPRLRAGADALVVELGNQRIVGRNVQAAYSFFGNSPPPNYQVVLLSEVRPGVGVEFIVYRDRTGLYATFEADPGMRAILGKAAPAVKYRHCSGSGARQGEAPPVRPPPPAPRTPEPATMGPADLLNDARFKAAYYRALGGWVREPWLARLDGPGPPVRRVRLGGADYLMASACKPHDCADHNTVLLYSSAQGAVYGRLFQRGVASFIGAPPAHLAAALERLWRAEWRQVRG